MGIYYSIYAEARVGNKWYNISPMMKNKKGEYRAQPVISGQSWLREAVDELEDQSYMCGRPDDLSEEIRAIYNQDDDADAGFGKKEYTYKRYYSQTLFVVNYGKTVKSRVKENRPTRYQGYVNKHCLAAYEIGEVDDIANWIHATEYEKLSPKEKKDYAYYEWNEYADWYGIYSDLVNKVDSLLAFFQEWASYNIPDADIDEKLPSADYVRLIVYHG